MNEIDTSRDLAGYVFLRAVTESDLPLFYQHQLDPDATAMAAFPAKVRDTFMAHWAKIRADDAIIKQTILFDGQVAGYMVCFEQEDKRLVGYWIGKSLWGKGIATRALATFVNNITFRPLYAYVAQHNIASRRVLEKCGFRIVGEGLIVSNAPADGIKEFILKLD